MTRAITVRALFGRTVPALALLSVVVAVPVRANVLPKVRLVATGGTISNRPGGRLTAEDLVNAVPAVRRYVRPEFEQFSNVPSSELTLGHWLQLARRLNQAFTADADLAGIVVTTGTDTLEETAYFLNLTVRSPRPVVVVGSMREPGSAGYDGSANLLAGFRVAADPSSRGKGVLVVLNDEINAAREVTKTDAMRTDTFTSHEVGVLGVVDADRVVFYRAPVKRHTARSEFDVVAIRSLPRVDIVLVYQDAPGDLITAAVNAGAKGLIVATAGAGSTSGTQNGGLTFAARNRVFLVFSTRTGAGRVPPSRVRVPPPLTPDEEQRQPFTISAEDLAPLKARILLMLALTRTTSRDEIQRMFEEY